MATINNQMNVTQYGLTRISEELIAEREFDPDKIDIIGSPLIEGNGVLSSLDSLSAAGHSGLDFDNNGNLRITFEGITGTLPANISDQQCLWELRSENGDYFNLSLYKNKIALETSLSGSIYEIFSISLIKDLKSIIDSGSRVAISVLLNKNGYQYNYSMGKEVDSDEGNYHIDGHTVSLHNFTSIIIGNDNIDLGSQMYWKGSIQLARFKINKNGALYYTPSNEVYFTFSKVAISDGTNPLSNDSEPLNGKVYFFNIEEISRTENNLLLKTTVDAKAYLTIREIGLYINVKGKDKLFSVITDLNVEKASNIGYDLIFHVNLDISVMNTELFPEIVFSDVHEVSKRDFVEVKKITLAAFSDMEVAVAKNAYEIGANKAQCFYKLSDSINLNKENWMTTQHYKKLTNTIKAGTTSVFNPQLVSKSGNITISSDGIASNFTGDFGDGCSVTMNATFNAIYLPTGLDLNLKFITSTNNTSNKDEVVFQLGGPSSGPATGSWSPIFITMCNEELKIRISSAPTITINSNIVYALYGTEGVGGEEMFKWMRVSSIQSLPEFIYSPSLDPSGSIRYANYYTPPGIFDIDGNVLTYQQLVFQDPNEYQCTFNNIPPGVPCSVRIIKSYNSNVYTVYVQLADGDVRTNSITLLSADRLAPVGTIQFGEFEGVEYNGFSRRWYSGNTNPSMPVILYAWDYLDSEVYTVSNTPSSGDIVYRSVSRTMRPYATVSSYDSVNDRIAIQGGTVGYRSSLSDACLNSIPYTRDSFSANNPKFFSGSVDLSSFNLKITENGTFGPVTLAEYNALDETTTTTSTKDFIHFPYFPYNSYSAKNLMNMEDFKVLDNTFVGSEDTINFDNGLTLDSFTGFTLCAKIDIRDSKDKLFFTKRLDSDNQYCSLEFKDDNVVFTLYPSAADDVVASWYVPKERFSSYVRGPLLFTFIIDGYYDEDLHKVVRTLRMYKNNELIYSDAIADVTFKNNPSNYRLYNYFINLYAWTYEKWVLIESGESYIQNKYELQHHVVYTKTNTITSTTPLYDVHGEPNEDTNFSIQSIDGAYRVAYNDGGWEETTYSFSESVVTDHDMYISDIITFDGPITEKQLYYLNNLLDTNF